MKKLKLVTGAALALLVIAAKMNAEVSVSRRSQHISGQEKFGYSSRSLENGKFIYTVCDNGEVQRQCRIVQEDISSGNVTYSCDIILKIDEGMEFGLFLELAFGKNKAVLIWEEKQGLEQTFKMYIRFTTIQFDNCQVGEVKLLDDNKALHREPIHHQLFIGEKVIMRRAKYDVFFEDRTKCGKQECQLSIDYKGRIINMTLPVFNGSPSDSRLDTSNIPYHPTFVGNSPYHIRMLKVLSKNKPVEIFTSLKMNKNEAILTVIVPGVSEKIALRIHSEESDILSHSVEHETVGICVSSKEESRLTCSQYDVNGNPKSEVNLPAIEAHMSSMYILPNGGFLLLALKLERCQPSDENCDTHHIAAYYRIIKVDATGKTKELRFEGFNKIRIGQYAEFIYENPNGEGYCVTIVYGNYVVESKYIGGKVVDRNVVTNCFTADDFIE